MQVYGQEHRSLPEAKTWAEAMINLPGYKLKSAITQAIQRSEQAGNEIEQTIAENGESQQEE